MAETILNCNDECFACGRRIKAGQKVWTARVDTESTLVFVGPECWEKIDKAGVVGYQPPLGGPRLFNQ